MKYDFTVAGAKVLDAFVDGFQVGAAGGVGAGAVVGVPTQGALVIGLAVGGWKALAAFSADLKGFIAQRDGAGAAVVATVGSPLPGGDQL